MRKLNFGSCLWFFVMSSLPESNFFFFVKKSEREWEKNSERAFHFHVFSPLRWFFLWMKMFSSWVDSKESFTRLSCLCICHRKNKCSQIFFTARSEIIFLKCFEFPAGEFSPSEWREKNYLPMQGETNRNKSLSQLKEIQPLKAFFLLQKTLFAFNFLDTVKIASVYSIAHEICMQIFSIGKLKACCVEKWEEIQSYTFNAAWGFALMFAHGDFRKICNIYL